MTDEARDAHPFGVGGVRGHGLGADRDVVPAVDVEETVEELLGKPWHRGEEAAVARLGGQPVEGRHQLLPVRAAQQPEPDRRAVGEAMSRAVVSGEARRVTVRPFPDS